MSSVERDERLAEPSDEAIDQAREAMCFTAELGMDDVCPPRRKVIDGLRLAYAIDGVRAARSQGAVPSPDGPDSEHQHLRDAMARIARALGHTVPLVLEVTCQDGESPAQRIAREVEELAGRGSPDGGDLPAPRVERHPDWEGGWVLHFKTYSVAVAQLEREQRRDAAYAEAARDPAFCADMKALTHGVGALPAPRDEHIEYLARIIRIGLRPTDDESHRALDELETVALVASRSGGGSPPCPVCSRDMTGPSYYCWNCRAPFKGAGATPPVEGSRE